MSVNHLQRKEKEKEKFLSLSFLHIKHFQKKIKCNKNNSYSLEFNANTFHLFLLLFLFSHFFSFFTSILLCQYEQEIIETMPILFLFCWVKRTANVRTLTMVQYGTWRGTPSSKEIMECLFKYSTCTIDCKSLNVILSLYHCYVCIQQFIFWFCCW